MAHHSRWNPTVYSIIRGLGVDESATITYEQWAAARVAACNIGKRMNRCYQVLKTTPKYEEGDIEVKRTL